MRDLQEAMGGFLIRRSTSFAVLVATIGLVGEASAWTEKMDCNTGTIGQVVSKPSWEFFSDSIISNGEAFEGSQSCRLTATAGDTGFGEWGAIFYFPSNLGQGDELWIRLRTFFPEGFDFTTNSGSLKWLRVAVGDTGNGYIDMQIRREGVTDGDFRWWYERGSPVVLTPFGEANGPVKGVWETYEWYVRFHSQPSEAISRFWKNGVLLNETTGLETLMTAGGLAKKFYLHTYWNGGAPKTQTHYVDDIVITSDRPATQDAHGNPMIGTGASPPPPAAPAPPVLLP